MITVFFNFVFPYSSEPLWGLQCVTDIASHLSSLKVFTQDALRNLPASSPPGLWAAQACRLVARFHLQQLRVPWTVRQG